MAEQHQHYKYRPQKEYRNGLPWHKKVIRSVEKFNKILFLRLLGKILRIHPSDKPIPLDNVSSVLIIRYDALGDMIVTTPLWRILKRYKPSLTIGVAGSFKNLDLLRSDPDIDFLYDYSASSLKDFFRISKHTRKQHWDIVLMGNFNQKTRNAIISRLASSHGITATVGSQNVEGHQALFSRLISLPLPSNKMPMTEQLQYFLRSVIELPEAAYERPSIIVDHKVESTVAAQIKTILAESPSEKYIVLNIDAPEFKKWGFEKNMLLARYISEEYPQYAVFVTSLPANQTKIETLLKENKLLRVHYFPTPDIHAMTTLIRHSSLVITPDTSIVHLASAENIPVVAFYLTACEWLPYKVNSYIIIPSKGEPIESIPLELVKEGVRVMLENEKNRESYSTRIVTCDDPENIITLS